jgi:hypothetical protein
MLEPKPLRAYIAAQANVDTAVLRRLLHMENVIADDAFTLSASENVTRSIVRHIREADLVIAIIGKGGWTSYEIGIADALAKPVLVIAPVSTSMPTYIVGHQVLHSAVADTDVLRLTLRKLLDDVRKRPQRLLSRPSHIKRKNVPKTSEDLVGRIAAARQATSAHEVEALTVEMLREAGIAVAAQEPQHRERGVDLAVFVDALGPSVTGPVLIELKCGRLSDDHIRAAELQLVNAIQAIGGRLGLVLYLDADDKRFASRTWETPYVLRFDLEDLARALTRRSFANVIVDQRNHAVHGVR